ncbi:APC family permease [Rubellicoccus peritrichatus]|uniref:APC family permease n=1 Tax=Rubellicoccus peritrichatus TaxID=3080537 RepID=A0AAQ3LC73_9BACT|nr:APC family permease [Puniceicoccus sp. CR14]WOO43086.1 APC family permease [Puniceicoccus sp. CR14]
MRLLRSRMQTSGLKREVGVFGAVLLGLGSILGTGVFVVVGLGAGLAGWGVVPAIVLAGLLAVCNGLNSAQLAAAHPVSGGTYEYGYRLLTPGLGFTAGWLFLLAKSASAATAALAIGHYFFPRFEVIIALLIIAGMTALVLNGVRRSNLLNAVIVGLTVLAIVIYSLFGLFGNSGTWDGGFSALGTLEAAALLFVGYTGYGRIATMGEEISNPRRNIPRAMFWTLGVSALLYVGVGIASARSVPTPIFWKVAGIVAMLGVLLNLILGLSRVLLAMGRRGDMPTLFAKVDASDQPRAAVIGITVIIVVLSLMGSIQLAWSFSAFTVLCYYALTNLASLKLGSKQRLYPKWIAWCGLAGCLFLALWVPIPVMLSGLFLIFIGLVWQYFFKRIATKSSF